MKQYNEDKITVIGDYVKMNPVKMTEENIKANTTLIAMSLAKQLLDGNMAQVIVKKPEDLIGPFGGEVPDYGTVGVKLFVLPWKEAGAGLTGLKEKEEKDDGR